MDRVAVLGYEDKEQYDMFDDHVQKVVHEMVAWQQDVLKAIDECIRQFVAAVRDDWCHSPTEPRDIDKLRQQAVLSLLQWRQRYLDFEYLHWQERKLSVIEKM